VGQQGRCGSGSGAGAGAATASEPHMVFTYDDKQILEDAAALIIYHVKRQPAIHKDEKDHIKRIIQHFVPDLFFARRGELSDTEDWTDEEAEMEEAAAGGERGERGVERGGVGSGHSSAATTTTTTTVAPVAGAAASGGGGVMTPGSQAQQGQPQGQPQTQQLNGESRRRRCSPSQPGDAEPSPSPSSSSSTTAPPSAGGIACVAAASPTTAATTTPAATATTAFTDMDPTEPSPMDTDLETAAVVSAAPPGEKVVDLRDPEAEHQKELDGVYNLFFVNNNWYFFLRLHQTLCARLLRVYRQAERQLLEHRAEQSRERLLLAEGRRDKACDLAMELRLKQPSTYFFIYLLLLLLLLLVLLLLLLLLLLLM